MGNSKEITQGKSYTLLELSTFKHQTNKCLSLRFNFNNDALKNGKAAHFKNEPLFFTGWHKAALEQSNKINLLDLNTESLR